MDAHIFLSCFAFLRIYTFLLTFSALRQLLKQANLIALTFALTCGVASCISEQAGPFSSQSRDYLDLFSRGLLEVTTGFLLAAPLALTLESLPLSGRLIDLARGALVAEQQLPGLESRTSPLETLATYALPLFIFSFSGYELGIRSLYSSFQANAIPLGFEKVLFRDDNFLLACLDISTRLIKTAVVEAYPAVLFLFLLDFTLSLFSRLLNRLNLAGEFAPLRLVLGLCFTALIVYSSLTGPIQDLPTFQLARRGSILSSSLSVAH